MSFEGRESIHEQGSAEWLSDRMGCITGSIVGEIMPGVRGGAPQSRKKLLYKKAVEYMAEVDESQPINRKYAEWGHEWESEACMEVEQFLKENSYEDIKFREVGLVRSDFNNLVASSLDRIDLTGNYALEVKCPYYMSSHLKHINEKPVINCKTSGIEKNYYWQPRHHMLCTGAEWCIWGSYHPYFEPQKLYIEIIKRDEEEMELLKNTCNEFIEDMKEICKNIYKKDLIK
jgi:hypothetical protein